MTEIAAEACKKNMKLTSVSIGSNVQIIRKHAFNGCSALKKVMGGKKLTSIETAVFSGCKKLSSITLSTVLATIGDKAFYNCECLEQITLSSKVKSIGKSAFQNCKKLKKIVIKTTKLTDKTVGANAFKGIATTAQIQLPKERKRKYQEWIFKKGITKSMDRTNFSIRGTRALMYIH